LLKLRTRRGAPGVTGYLASTSRPMSASDQDAQFAGDPTIKA